MNDAIHNKHLTDDQKQTLSALFDECSMQELLATIAGIVRHRVPSYEHSQKAYDAVMLARVHARKGA